MAWGGCPEESVIALAVDQGMVVVVPIHSGFELVCFPKEPFAVAASCEHGHLQCQPWSVGLLACVSRHGLQPEGSCSYTESPLSQVQLSP